MLHLFLGLSEVRGAVEEGNYLRDVDREVAKQQIRSVLGLKVTEKHIGAEVLDRLINNILLILIRDEGGVASDGRLDRQQGCTVDAHRR